MKRIAIILILLTATLAAAEKRAVFFHPVLVVGSLNEGEFSYWYEADIINTGKEPETVTLSAHRYSGEPIQPSAAYTVAPQSTRTVRVDDKLNVDAPLVPQAPAALRSTLLIEPAPKHLMVKLRQYRLHGDDLETTPLACAREESDFTRMNVALGPEHSSYELSNLTGEPVTVRVIPLGYEGPAVTTDPEAERSLAESRRQLETSRRQLETLKKMNAILAKVQEARRNHDLDALIELRGKLLDLQQEMLEPAPAAAPIPAAPPAARGPRTITIPAWGNVTTPVQLAHDVNYVVVKPRDVLVARIHRVAGTVSTFGADSGISFGAPVDRQ
jgi:hypothetical protein